MKLSIVISAYNVEAYIAKTLRSVLDQTEQRFELIVVNDGSNDGTLEVIQETLRGNFQGEFKIISKKNGGVSDARNTGLLESSGDYILFLDGDDYIADYLVKSIYSVLKNQKPDVLCWGYDLVDERGLSLEKYFNKFEHILEKMDGIKTLEKIFLSRTLWICTGSAAFRKQLLESCPLFYTVGCTNGEDQEFTIKALSKASSVIFLNEVLAFYVQRKGSISTSGHLNKFDALDALKRACYYLEESHNAELIRIAALIKNQELTENFFNILDSCMVDTEIGSLLDEIDKRYPELIPGITKSLRSYSREKKKIWIKCVLYLISPNLYANTVILKRRISG
ncbi:glycosyltransferase family 2 protein [Acidaminobacter hydrogenoformans]|uniref:Glycosyltransferase involved in cell wall bisynthesis n=1 Tax=Acidaminobacter hydrogenoformans DSM 2784 TaxID=1120920 RepID=A0A1G5RPL1_9FIRM|nr:glycosyltransferase [Acidaminobacter hydrogenoformans]SCZ76075.1 Glycosyltransferase involved in cell wall bisynthesis [Acidaminobacter hydrogenoformans DSM 2784]